MTELTLREFFHIIARHIWAVVLLPFCAVVITTLLVYFVIPPVYTAQASMYVLNKQSTENTVNYSDLQSSLLLTADYRELVLSERVLGEVAANYGLDVDRMKEDFKIEVTSANNTRMIVISVASTDPVMAANLANAIGERFSSTVVEIMDADNVNFVDYAKPPVKPSAPKKLMVVLIAGVAVFLISIGVVVLMRVLDTKFRTVEDVEKALGASVLARIPKYEVK